MNLKTHITVGAFAALAMARTSSVSDFELPDQSGRARDLYDVKTAAVD